MMIHVERITLKVKLNLKLQCWSQTYEIRIRKVPNTSAADEDANNAGKKVIFKNCAPFTDCISEINNTKIENSEGLDVAMPVHNLIEYSDIYWKTSAKLRQHCKDIPSANNAAIIDFNKANVANSFNFKEKP